MIMQGYYRIMIDACHTRANTEALYGEFDIVAKELSKGIRYAGKLKRIAKSQRDLDVAEAALQTNSLILATLRGEKTPEELRKGMWEIEAKYPSYFLRGRRDIGTSKDAVAAIIHRFEYAADRYDAKYPSYDMHRCNDR